MSGRRYENGYINILENITIIAPNTNKDSKRFFLLEQNNQNHLNLQQSNPDKENKFSHDYTIGVEDISGSPKHTTGMCFSDEESVFSDSEEEREYTRSVLQSQNLSFSSEKPKKASIAIQCDLISYKSELLDIIRKCTSLNIEDVNEDFRELIHLCRQLEYKYQYDTPPLSELNNCNSTNASITENISSHNSHRQILPTKSPRLHISSEFLPSRQGGDFFSEIITPENIQLNITSIVESLSTEDKLQASTCIDKENKVNTLRRSSRQRKPNNLNKSRSIIGKSRLQKLRKGREQKIKKNQDIRKNFKSKSTTLHKNNKKRKMKVEDIVFGFIRGNKSRADKKKLLVSPKRKGHVDELENFHVKRPLPKKQVRTLARNWMKPNKSTINYELNGWTSKKTRRLRSLTNEWRRWSTRCPHAFSIWRSLCKSSWDLRISLSLSIVFSLFPLHDLGFLFSRLLANSGTQRVRQLYSPTEWLQSLHFANLRKS